MQQTCEAAGRKTRPACSSGTKCSAKKCIGMQIIVNGGWETSCSDIVPSSPMCVARVSQHWLSCTNAGSSFLSLLRTTATVLSRGSNRELLVHTAASNHQIKPQPSSLVKLRHANCQPLKSIRSPRRPLAPLPLLALRYQPCPPSPPSPPLQSRVLVSGCSPRKSTAYSSTTCSYCTNTIACDPRSRHSKLRSYPSPSNYITTNILILE